MVAIKDFGMPSCCVDCDMCTSDNPSPKDENRGYCHVTQKSITNIYDERPSGCPLIDIEERKVGKWILPDKYYDKNIWRKCSVCNIHFEKYHKYVTFSGEVTYIEEIANYCKVCGAEMRG